MKKIFHLLPLTCVCISAMAQSSIPNGNFETWTSGTYDYPQYYPSTSNPSTFFQCQTPFNITKTTDAFQGTYGIQLTTNASATDTCGGYFLNIANPNGDPSTWKGGIPYNQKPTGIRGYYKYNVATADSGLIIVVCRQGGTTIGTYMYLIGGVKSVYTLFNFTFSPALPATPDSIIFAAASSDLINTSGVPGSILKLDSISFTGVATQPAQMNGAFELWQSQTLYNPNSWISQGNNEGTAINRTVDVAAGIYAMELITYQGDNNGIPRAQAAYISTGYYPNNCGVCNQQGGYPFSNTIDTLVFSYKYAPTIATDSAQVSLNFKKNGIFIGYASKNLGTSASYQTVQIPFNIFTAPDSVIVSIQSSLWNDTLLSFVGADLKVDEMHFKTQPLATAIKNYDNDNEISIFPNPSSDGIFTINFGRLTTDDGQLDIYNVLGEKIFSSGNLPRLIGVEHQTPVINLSKQPTGIYFVKVISKEKIFVKKINVSNR